MKDVILTTDHASATNCDITSTWISKIFENIKYFIAIFSGIMLTLDIIVLKKKPYLLENKTHVLFWLYLSNSIVSFLLMSIFENPVLPSNWLEVFYMSLHSVVYILVQPLEIIAASHISGNTINICLSSIVIFMLIPQYTFLSHIHSGHRNWMEVLGAILVFLGTTLGSLLEIFKNKLQLKGNDN